MRIRDLAKPGWRKPILIAALLLVAAVVLKLYGPEWDRQALIDWARQLPASLFIAGFLALPLVGMPITIFLVAAGIKFGLTIGMLVTAGCIAFHNLVAYWLTHSFFKQPVKRFLTQRGHDIPKVPERHQAWFTVAFTGVPSLPYTSKLYLLALTNISFRIYFVLGWPTYSLFSILLVGLGNAAVRLSGIWVAALSLLAVLFGVLSYIVHKKLRRKMGS